MDDNPRMSRSTFDWARSQLALHESDIQIQYLHVRALYPLGKVRIVGGRKADRTRLGLRGFQQRILRISLEGIVRAASSAAESFSEKLPFRPQGDRWRSRRNGVVPRPNATGRSVIGSHPAIAGCFMAFR